MATLVSLKIITKNVWMEVMGSSQKQKTNISQKVELKKRKVIFRRATTFFQKSEVDLILVLNKVV